MGFLLNKPLLCIALLLPMVLSACDGNLESLLERLSGMPSEAGTTEDTPQTNDPVPAGPHLYCITNIGHSMVAYSLTGQEVLSGTKRLLELDPVGPWFIEGMGYYLSRVAAGGAGANALIEFDPETLAETRRLNFPGNSNPASMIHLPGTGLIWVALRGSTFDNFATNGLSVVELEGLSQTAFLDLNQPAYHQDGAALTFLTGFYHDSGCALGRPCVYGVVNNWRNNVRDSWLLVLEPNGVNLPIVHDFIRLGKMAQESLLMSGGKLWVVNNGGFSNYSTESGPGNLMALDPATFADGTPGNEISATLAIETACNPPPSPDTGCDPTGLYPVGGMGWLTTYPDQIVREIDLATPAVLPHTGSLPELTGPVFSTTSPAPGRYAGQGGYGTARLARLDPVSGAIIAEHDLTAGEGTITCAEYNRP